MNRRVLSYFFFSITVSVEAVCPLIAWGQSAVPNTNPQSPGDSTRWIQRTGPIVYWVVIWPSGDEHSYSTVSIELSQHSVRKQDPPRKPFDTVIVSYADGDIDIRNTSLTIRVQDTSFAKLKGDRIYPKKVGRTSLYVEYANRCVTVPIYIRKESGHLRVDHVLESF
jgi:hypothetical protein